MFKNILASVIVFNFLLWSAQGSPVTNITTIDHAARLLKAENILKYMNTSLDPCEDFYGYTCGNYPQYNPFDKYSPFSVNPLAALNLAMEAKIKAELKIDNPSDTEYDKSVKNFYSSCLALPAEQSSYADKLKDLTKEFGQMPALVEGTEWQERDFNWWEIVAKMAYKTNTWFVIGGGIAPNLTGATTTYGVLGQVKFRLNGKCYYVQEAMKPMHEKLKQHDASILHRFLGINMELANRIALEMLEFEIALAHGLPKAHQPNEQLTLVNIKDLQMKYQPAWDTEKFLQLSLAATPSLVYANYDYLDNVLKVLNNTANRVVANYIYYSYLSQFIFDPTKSALPIEDYCVRITRDHFYKYLDNLMYRKHFSEDAKKGLYTMWQDLKTTFEELLQSSKLKWLTNDTLTLATEKLKAMQLHINSYEDTDFSKDFNHLYLTHNDFLHNINAIFTLRSQQARTLMGDPHLAVDSAITPQYKYTENRVQIPVAFLMPHHFWSTAYPYAYNFANMGFYIAHEIVHGFDDLGRYYDEQGQRQGWWDLSSFLEFEKRTKCFVAQYSRYEVNGRPLGEIAAQSENIADNGGVRLAYEAYEKWQAKSEHLLVTESLPGVPFTHKQLFFISYGQAWCSNVNVIFQTLDAMNDHHMPSKYRVIGPLSNLDQFSQAFNCPKGSTMNPVIKCRIY